MDIYDYLKADHRKVSHLFAQYEKTEMAKRKLEIIAYLIKELNAHAVAEEETFYKLMRADPNSKEDIKHAEKEHAEIFQCIAKIEEEIQVNSSFEKHVLELKKIVDHHVKEEEGKIFADAKKIFSDSMAKTIKEKMHNFKIKLLQVSKKRTSEALDS